MKLKATTLNLLIVMVFCQVAASDERPVYPKLESVFQHKRSDMYDTIHFRDKDKFAGMFIDEAHEYAPEQFGVQQPIAGESDSVASTRSSVGSAGDKIVLNLEPTLGKKGVKMEFVRVPTGEFIMGNDPGEANWPTDEGPAHKVKISKPFYMGLCEVTQKQYAAVMGSNPSKLSGPDNPVELVSWKDAMKFCEKMSAITKKTITLPTEAQWEYACRAGTNTSFCFGDSNLSLGDYAWYNENSGSKTHPVGLRKPNAWGLYDMHGNVWEWCSDWYDSNYYKSSPSVDPIGPTSGRARVIRGGCWYGIAFNCRSANRSGDPPNFREHIVGFRVVLSNSN